MEEEEQRSGCVWRCRMSPVWQKKCGRMNKDYRSLRGFNLVAKNAFEENGPVQENRLHVHHRCLVLF